MNYENNIKDSPVSDSVSSNDLGVSLDDLKKPD